jgi:hypothetical protein
MHTTKILKKAIGTLATIATLSVPLLSSFQPTVNALFSPTVLTFTNVPEIQSFSVCVFKKGTPQSDAIKANFFSISSNIPNNGEVYSTYINANSTCFPLTEATPTIASEFVLVNGHSTEVTLANYERDKSAVASTIVSNKAPTLSNINNSTNILNYNICQGDTNAINIKFSDTDNDNLSGTIVTNSNIQASSFDSSIKGQLTYTFFPTAAAVSTIRNFDVSFNASDAFMTPTTNPVATFNLPTSEVSKAVAFSVIDCSNSSSSFSSSSPSNNSSFGSSSSSNISTVLSSSSTSTSFQNTSPSSLSSSNNFSNSSNISSQISAPYVAITNIQILGTQYLVDFVPYGYTPTPGGMHTHFYYNTESSLILDKMFSGPSPYSLETSTKPANATQLCAIVSEANHTPLTNSGYCYFLPNSGQIGTSSSSMSFNTQNSSSINTSSISTFPTLGAYFGSPITGFLGGTMPNITLTGSNIANGTTAYFTSGYNLPVVGTIQGDTFVPNQGQTIPTGATIGSASGILSVNIEGQPSLKLIIPTNFNIIRTGGGTGGGDASTFGTTGGSITITTTENRAINTKGAGSNIGKTDTSDTSSKGGEPAGYNCAGGGNRAINTKGAGTNTGRGVGPDGRDCISSPLSSPAAKNAIKTKGVGKNIEPVVSNTELVQFEDGTRLTIARRGWDGSIKGIGAGDQLVIEEPCQGSFGQVALTFKKGISEGGLKLTEIDQNNLFPNLVGDLSNGCNMSISGFDKDDVAKASVYLGNSFGEKVNAGLNQAGSALASDSGTTNPSTPTSAARKFFRVVKNGTLINPETNEFLQAQFSNSPWKTADIAIDEDGQYYVSIPSAFKQFAITKGVLNSTIEKPSNIALTRTGGSPGITLSSLLALFLISGIFVATQIQKKE